MELGLERIDHRNTDSKVYDVLTEQIVSGALVPGVRITEEELAEALGVSRTPVREAMRRLAQDGLVELFPRRGMQIKKLSYQDVAEVYEIRSVLEGLAASLATTKITDEDIADLRSQAAAAEPDLSKGDIESTLQFDSNLHGLIVERSGNRKLLTTLDSLNNLVSYFRREVARTVDRAVEASEEHQRILAALERRDAVAAESEMRAHVAKSGERILRDIKF